MMNDNRSRTAHEVGGDRKASGILLQDKGDTADAGARTRQKRADARRPETIRRKTPVWLDVILILLLLGAIVGGVFAYRFLRSIYAPAWETREVVYVLELSDLDTEILPAYWNRNAPAYASNESAATPIGYLKDVEYVATLPADGEDETGTERKVLRLTLAATARYREEKGYYVGELPLFAGMSTELRVDGVSTTGLILSVYEAEEYESITAALPTATE